VDLPITVKNGGFPLKTDAFSSTVGSAQFLQIPAVESHGPIDPSW